MKLTFTVILFTLFFPHLLKAQDSTLKKLAFTAGFETLARQHLYPSYTSVALQPDVIRKLRRTVTSLPINFDTVTDNPFRHGAMYVAVKTTATYKNKIRLNADIYGEYRGFSYGTFNKHNNLVLFPVLSVQVKDTIDLGKEQVIAEARIGQFLDERLDEGIMIYNIDLQGSQFKLRHRNSRVVFTIYGDLYNAIGLGVDDLKSLSYEHLFKSDSARVGASWVIAGPPYAPARYHSYFNLFGRVTTRKGFDFYAQFSYTPYRIKNIFEGLRRFHKEMAAVAGIQHRIETSRFRWSNRIEARYYGTAYNFFHHESKLLYRDSASNTYEMYGNTVGEYLYPLRKFDTPFSQWAVFTEYTAHQVSAVTINGELDYRLHQKLSLRFAYDINAIHARLDEIVYSSSNQRASFFVYPFFKTAVAYTPVKECHFSVFIANRSMNLDVSYPTHYLHRKVFFGGELYIRI
jgi:hypothetical protein